MSADKSEERVSDLEQYFKMLWEMVRRPETDAELSQGFLTVAELLQKHDDRSTEGRNGQA
jgi:hypothetical protein